METALFESKSLRDLKVILNKIPYARTFQEDINLLGVFRGTLRGIWEKEGLSGFPKWKPLKKYMYAPKAPKFKEIAPKDPDSISEFKGFRTMIVNQLKRNFRDTHSRSDSLIRGILRNVREMDDLVHWANYLGHIHGWYRLDYTEDASMQYEYNPTLDRLLLALAHAGQGQNGKALREFRKAINGTTLEEDVSALEALQEAAHENMEFAESADSAKPEDADKEARKIAKRLKSVI